MALALGCTVRELLTRLDVCELQAWEAYYAVEPWGELRADLRMAVQLHYQLSPYMDDSAEPPDLIYPYFEDPVQTAADIAEAQARFRELEAGWIKAVEQRTTDHKQ